MTKIIDTHVHFFPDSLAERAMSQLTETSGFPGETDGTRGDCISKLKAWGIQGAAALHIATTPHQQQSVNNFAAQSQDKFMLCLGSVHPDAPDALEELERIVQLGLKGVKLHPDYQNFMVSETRMFPIYSKIQELGLPLAVHSGYDPVSPDCIHCPPKELRKVADEFPKLKIIAAHMGGAYESEDAVKYLADKKNVYVDTAVMCEFLDSDSFRAMVKKFGADRIFFATDLPWANAPSIMEIIENSGLEDEEKEKIYHKNAERFFGYSR